MVLQMKQVMVMISANLRSLPQRIWISLSMVLSVALVVAVLTGFLAMAKGFETALAGNGSSEIAVILGGGTNQETSSDIPAGVIRSLQATSADLGLKRDAAGAVIFSRETVVPVEIQSADDGSLQTLALRGMDATGIALRPNAAIAVGRSFAPGTREIIVGRDLAARAGVFGIGERVRLGAVDWQVVGHFTAGGGAMESEIWGELEAVQAAFDQMGQVQILRAALEGGTGLEQLQATLPALSQTPLTAVTEVELLSAQSARTSTLIRMFGWPLAILMSIGATIGAINTMMTSVANRAMEIATVRTLGFSRLSAFAGTWVEAVALSIFGAILGAVASWLVFHGWQASTVGPNNTTTAFQLEVSMNVLRDGALLGIAIGMIGGALPALAATRVKLATALRSTG
ncbi:ABC-type antimicrobial peptide transport system, permease component [Phaeobacter gallaeciensis]|nr:ABC-type antimicrobial peptide transport system, permease component [Phaeobacter gallaeciensis]ATF22695.1 ABC-type antimicrobial peptide transport system, permease component [Phaeobacter gallaeciensis]